MSENINNIPENEQNNSFVAAPNNYLDFIVEEDVIEPKKNKFSVTKLLAMIFGIISGLFLLYYSVEFFNANREQIAQYAQMGIQLPMSSLITVYANIALIFLASLAPIVGGILPKKYAKCSILLLTIPVSYTLITALPQLILCIASKIPFVQAYTVYLLGISGILSLAAAILNMFTGHDCCCCEDDFDYFDYEEDDLFEIDEETEELLEEADKEVEELLDEAEEAVEEVTEEATEETNEVNE